MANEFIINGNTYTNMKLDAFTQLHISRKVAPVFVDMMQQKPTVSILSTIDKSDLDDILKSIMPFVKRKDNGAWASIYNSQAGLFSYDDISGGDLLEIMFAVIMQYIAPFFTAIDHLSSSTQK